MFIKYPWIYIIFIIVLISVDTDAQVCERFEVVTSKVGATNSFLVTYYTQCPGLCIKTKWVTTTNRRPIIKSRLKSIKFCCKGYIQDNDLSNDTHIECKAICIPACKNGFCSAPGVCACNAGYSVDPKDAHNCLPVCENGCDHGTCIAPNKCRCEFGYNLVNGSCQPICTEPCHNGTCVAPETCECNPGYRKSEKNLCQPYCSNGCDNGFCSAPETCTCNPGWHLTESKVIPIKSCKPLCSTPCDNGVCIAPDTCKCLPSYKKSADDICEPVCPSGWKSENLKCVAQCRHACGNGTCASPNVCVCFPGYSINIKQRMGLTGEPLCIPSCIDCAEKKGICVAPGVCINKDSTTTLPRLCESSQNCSAMTNQATSVTLLDETTETYTYDNDFDVMSTSISQENVEPTPHFMSNASSISPAGTSTQFLDGKFMEKTANAKSVTNSWLQQHWASIFIPLLIIATAAIIMFLVLRWKPLFIYFKGSSYVLEDDVVYSNGPYGFEDIQITPRNK